MQWRLCREDGKRGVPVPAAHTPLSGAIGYFFAVFLVALFLLPSSVRAEYIEKFSSTIDVHEDASFSVAETIQYVFTEDRHGILREIPLIHHEKASAFWKERIIEVALTEVKKDGSAVPFVLESTNDRFILRIGDPESTVNGSHTYEITYDVLGGLSYPKGQGVELYWNVTGNEWPVPIRTVETTLRDPDQIFRSSRSCYRGILGSTDGSCLTNVDEKGNIIYRTTELGVGEGMTIAQDLDVVRVSKDIRERTNILFLVIPLGLLVFFVGAFQLYRYKTAHKTRGPIIPEYEPYPDLKPMYTGLLMDGRLDARDITATIVYLAEQGYVRIRKTEKKAFFLFEVDDYEVTLLKLPDAGIGEFESRVFGLIFKTPLILGSKVSLSDLKNDQSEQRQNYAEFMELQKDLRNDLVRAGFQERASWKSMMKTIGTVLALWVILSTIIAGEVNGVILISGACIAVVSGVLLYERRTRKGYEIRDYLKGFKLFLETTERDRYLFHNAPEKSPEQFMEYLPYAIAFGVEKKWAEVFKDITIPNPGWYDGGSTASFNATNLTSSLGAFSTAFASSSGASASSGGGSSGGGAGGGGGGSW